MFCLNSSIKDPICVSKVVLVLSSKINILQYIHYIFNKIKINNFIVNYNQLVLFFIIIDTLMHVDNLTII